MRAALDIKNDFKKFKTEGYHIYDGLVSALPEKYELQYIVFGASTSILEEEKILDLPLKQVITRSCLSNFQTFVNEEFRKIRMNNG